VKMFDGNKTRMIGLLYGEKNYDNMLSCLHSIPERYGRTDRRRDRIAISISRVSVLTRDKNCSSAALLANYSASNMANRTFQNYSKILLAILQLLFILNKNKLHLNKIAGTSI